MQQAGNCLINHIEIELNESVVSRGAVDGRTEVEQGGEREIGSREVEGVEVRKNMDAAEASAKSSEEEPKSSNETMTSLEFLAFCCRTQPRY